MSEEEKQELATKYYECWQDAEARCLALETWVKAVGKRREAAESRAAQLEEALEELRSSFEVRIKRAEMWVDEGELNDYWRGNRAALEVCLHKLAALSPSKEAEDE